MMSRFSIPIGNGLMLFERSPETTLVTIGINGILDRRWKRNVKVMEVGNRSTFILMLGSIGERKAREKGIEAG